MSIKRDFNQETRGSLDQKFLDAVKANKLELALKYLGAGANIDARDDKNNTALIWVASQPVPPAGEKDAALKDYTALGLKLIERHASIDFQGLDDASALIAASRNRNVPLAKALIGANADVTLEDRHGKRALDYAMKTSDAELVSLFEEPLKKILKRIVTPDKLRSLDVNEVHPLTGETMLTAAAGRPGLEFLAEAFLDAGAQRDKPRRDGKTPTQVAQEAHNEPMLKLLKARPQDPPAERTAGSEKKPLFNPQPG